jgi:hypothetical protein
MAYYSGRSEKRKSESLAETARLMEEGCEWKTVGRHFSEVRLTKGVREGAG